jgi:hypothetical protein
MGGMSQLVLDHYGYNTLRTTIFLKTYSDDTLRCLYKDYSSLNMWQANRDLLSVIYSSVMKHQRKGKKVSILLPGDVNLRPVPSR